MRRYEGAFLGGFGAQSQVVLCSALLGHYYSYVSLGSAALGGSVLLEFSLS